MTGSERIDSKRAKDLRGARRAGLLLNLFFGVYTPFLLISLLEGYELIRPLDTVTMSLFLGVGLVLGAFYHVRKRSLGIVLSIASNRVLRQQVGDLATAPAFEKWLGFVFLVATFWVGLVMTETSFVALFSAEGLEGAQRMFSAILQPELSIWKSVVRAMIQTIFLAFIATALSLPLAFLAGFISARNLMKGTTLSMGLYSVTRFVLNFTRSVEPIIWAIIFSVWVGIGPFAGMLALMLHSIASLAKHYSEQIECIEQGPLEAIQTTGANRLQVIWYAVVPQIILPFLAFTIYRWDINVRMATIIGLVGGGGIGTLLMQYQGLGKWNEVGTIIILIAFVVWIMDYLSARIREAIY